MKREELINYLKEFYDAEPEYMWAKYPNFCVFRHGHGRKWFTILMDAPNKTLGLGDSGKTDVINVRLAPAQIDDLLASKTPGFLPAYHMNKSSWISVIIEQVTKEQITKLLAASWENTKK